MIFLRPAIALCAVLVCATPGLAMPRHAWNGYAADPGDGDTPEGYLPALSAARGTLCVKQCPADSLPCDPPSFKIADGRCTTQWR